jgi:hypothetical protein
LKDDFRQKMLESIRSNIERSGHHIYAIQGGESPRYLYTIGLKEVIGGEIVLAGAAHMSVADAGNLMDTIAKSLRAGAKPDDIGIEKGRFGTFRLFEADHSWSELMLFGVYDYYDCVTTRAWQVRPTNPVDVSIDIPNMQEPFDPGKHRVWKWLDGSWPYRVPSSTPVVTNWDAMHGFAISELMRWEEDHWEMYSGDGSQVSEGEALVVPMATLLAFDPTLEPALSIPVETGLYREYDEETQGGGAWQTWHLKSG